MMIVARSAEGTAVFSIHTREYKNSSTSEWKQEECDATEMRDGIERMQKILTSEAAAA